MALLKSTHKISVEDYLEGEKISEIRHEYLDGEVYAMSGASRRHNEICGNLYERLRTRLRGGQCRTYMNEVKVYVAAHNAFYYPDVVVTCDPQDDDEYIIKHPSLIVEVLSPSTEATDRREKLFAYQKIESLVEYVIVEQDKIGAIRHYRDAQRQWLKEYLTAEDVLNLESVELKFPLTELYEDVF
ncbi:MAG: Uma2 family endonuclease [Pyrinomonadaceae bacterium]